MTDSAALLPGTLDLLILKAVSLGELHGYGVLLRVQQMTRGGLAVAGVIRVIFPFPALFTLDKATALETARKLRALEPSRLATGHGAVLESPLAEMDKAIAEASRKFGNQKSHVS
jgi:hypothetical protein